MKFYRFPNKFERGSDVAMQHKIKATSDSINRQTVLQE